MDTNFQLPKHMSNSFDRSINFIYELQTHIFGIPSFIIGVEMQKSHEGPSEDSLFIS